MPELTLRERQLVSIGAAIGSNCVPCIECLVPASRKAGLPSRDIAEAIALADKVRRVPARKVLETAIGLLPEEASTLKRCVQEGSAAEEASGKTGDQ